MIVLIKRVFSFASTRSILMTINESFVGSHLHYCICIIYGQSYNDSFKQKAENVQYNACLAIKVELEDTIR